MEDEEGYTVLNFRSRMRTSEPLGKPATQDPPPCPRWHWPALGIGWAGDVVLLGAVVAMGVLGNFKTPENDGANAIPSNGSNRNTELEEFRFHIRHFLCEPPSSNSGEGSACKLCPKNWLLHRDKCYWASTEKHSWNESRDNCSKRSARMLTIEDQDEMAFIQNTAKDANGIWLGLTTASARTSKWENGSLFNQTLFKAVDPLEENSCGTIKTDQINFETCSAVFKWICEKDALPI